MWSVLLRFIKILLSGFILLIISVQSIVISQPTNCLSGCKCSSVERADAAICCLIDLSRFLLLSSQSTNDYTLPSDIKQCNINLNQYIATAIGDITNSNSSSNQFQWPNRIRCLPSWRQLKIQLTHNSWPVLITGHSQPIQSNCMLDLERLVIVGQLNIYDGLVHLEPHEFRSHLFTDNNNNNNQGDLKLRRLTIEQTSLRKISQGFLDEIRAVDLNNLEIRRNVNLTDRGLGVGWLANIKHLQSLDLSQNNFYAINFATWGLPKQYTSLHNLDLSGNHIVYLKAQSFIRLPNLNYLNLANNYLSSLSSDVFIGLNQLKILDLQGNQLKSQGLILSVPNLDMILPGLRRLILSRNPLANLSPNTTLGMMDVMSTSVNTWWFSNSCPKLLTSLYLENIEPVSYLKHTDRSHSLLHLPIITWDYCESLSDVYLTHNDWLTCLDRRWLGATFSHGINVMSPANRFRIHPSILEVCPVLQLDNLDHKYTAGDNEDVMIKSDVISGNAGDSPMVGTTHVRTTSISLSTVYWPVSTEDAVRVVTMHNQNAKTKNYQQNYNGNNLIGSMTTSLNSWIILCLVIFLIFVVFSSIIFAIIYCVRYLNQRISKQNVYTSGTANNGLHLQHQNHLSPDLSTYKAGISMNGSSQILFPYPVNCIDLSKANQLLQYTDFPPMCSSCFSLKRQAVTQPVSPADSGLEDSTPLTLQQTRHVFPSLDRQLTRVSRRSRHHQHHNHSHHRRPLLDTTGFTRCPSTSISSLLLQHSPNRLPEIPYCWPPSISLSSQHRANAATSTEDVSIGPASTSVDTGDARSTPSDKTIPVITPPCKESV